MKTILDNVNPTLAEILEKSREEFKQGKTVSFEEMRSKFQDKE